MASMEHPDDDVSSRTTPNLPPVPSTCLKKFIFRSKGRLSHDYEIDSNTSSSDGKDPHSKETVLEIIIPERMEASYGLYVWPCAPILAWYLFEHRNFLRGKRVLELGAGTSLPGILSALCGANVILSDSGKLPHCLQQCRKSIEANGLTDKVQVVGITWGLFLHDIIQLRGRVDLILGSDCFFDPIVFEDLISTIAYLLGNNHNAKFIGTYQERSSDWSIEPLLKKWGLSCKHIPLNELASSCEVDLVSLMQDHTIHLIEITLQES